MSSSSVASAVKSRNKIPMGPNEFYSMRSKSRVTVDPKDVEVKVLTRQTKTGKTSTRYQAIGVDSDGHKVYKFISADTAQRLMSSE